MKNVVIVEDAEYHKEGMKGTVKHNFTCMAEFINSQDFFEKYKEFEDEVDVILIDYDLKRGSSVLNGDQIVKRLADENYQAKFAIVTGIDPFLDILHAAKNNGAAGFSQKAISAKRYKNFISQLGSASDFVIEEYTKDALIQEVLKAKEKQPQRKIDLKFHHIEMTKQLLMGKNSEEIIAKLFKTEFSRHLRNYFKYENYFHFPKIVQDIEDEHLKATGSTAKTKRMKVPLLEALLEAAKDIEQQDLCLFEKIHKLKQHTEVNKSDKIKESLKQFNKLTDTFLYAYKREIQNELHLPNTKRETLILGMIYHNFLTNRDIEPIFTH